MDERVIGTYECPWFIRNTYLRLQRTHSTLLSIVIGSRASILQHSAISVLKKIIWKWGTVQPKWWLGGSLLYRSMLHEMTLLGCCWCPAVPHRVYRRHWCVLHLILAHRTGRVNLAPCSSSELAFHGAATVWPFVPPWKEGCWEGSETLKAFAVLLRNFP